MYLSTAFIILIASTLSLANPMPAAAPNPDHVQIKDLKGWGGSGCPTKDSVIAITSSNHEVLTLLYTNFVASIGPGTKPADRRKNCQVTLDIQYPQGWQYSLFSADYRGYAGLEKGVTGEQVATYYFSGEKAQASSATKWVGPKSDDYLVSNEFLVESVVWSPCGASLPLQVNSQIRLTSTNPSASGVLSQDTTDFKFSQIFHIKWRQCK